MRRLVPLLCLLALMAGCGSAPDADPPTAASSATSPTGTSPTGTSTTAPSAATTPSGGADSSGATPRSPKPTPSARPRLVRGIDASHHQGAIDWPRVAGGGYVFAYLKATEGSSFTDPRFAANRSAAIRAGLRVAGYHYFSLCSPGAAQAEHFVSVLGDVAGPDHLPPAIDLELAGDCGTPPGRADLLTEVRIFLRTVAERTGHRPVVYLYPDFEDRYHFAADLAGYRHWVRALGDTPPTRPWWIWQRSATGSVPGISGPADINMLRTR